jgi:hypothetical protein
MNTRSSFVMGENTPIRRIAAALLFAALAGSVLIPAPTATADVCGSVGGQHVDVSGCTDPLAPEAVVPPPPPPDAPPAEDAPPPPPPPPPADVDVCADVGRRVSVGGCV